MANLKLFNTFGSNTFGSNTFGDSYISMAQIVSPRHRRLVTTPDGGEAEETRGRAMGEPRDSDTPRRLFVCRANTLLTSWKS